jgi:hypothetical protein
VIVPIVRPRTRPASTSNHVADTVEVASNDAEPAGGTLMVSAINGQAIARATRSDVRDRPGEFKRSVRAG